MNVKSYFFATFIVFTTTSFLCAGTPIASASENDGDTTDDPLISSPLSWGISSRTSDVVTLPLLRETAEVHSLVPRESISSVSVSVPPSFYLQSPSVLLNRTSANQTPLALDRARGQNIVSENGKKIQNQKLVKKDAKSTTDVQYTIASETNVDDLSAEQSVKRTMRVLATAYSSTPDQTDGDPCTTANGYNVCKANQENVLAANFLPFGTKVRLPEMYGDRVFVVQDRMAKRFSNRIDVWMKTRDAAVQFGARTVKIEVLED